VAFYRIATNVLTGATNVSEIYVRDVQAGTTVWVSAYARTALRLPAPPNTYSSLPFGHSISTNGHFVTYEATQGNLIGRAAPLATSPGRGVILRYNVASGLTDTVSTNAPVPIGAPEDVRNPVMTPDGRFGSGTRRRAPASWPAAT
jgi:hypothetical protein